MSTEPEKTSQTISSTASTSARITKCVQRGMFIVLILYLAVVTLVLCSVIPAAYDYDKYPGDIAQAVEPAGKVISVTLTDGLLPRALVETDTGFFSLGNGISLHKDKPLTLQVRANSDRYLCDDSQRCTRLLGAR